MARTSIDVPVSSVMRGVTMTVNVTGVTTWRIRQWVGIQLIALAARVMGCGIKFEGVK